MPHLARFDEVAEFYTQFASDVYDDPPMVALLQLIGEVTNLQLLDLACGHGRLTRELARRGARVVGVDISAALLEVARAREMEHPLHISYIHADAAALAIQGAVFDGVTCSFGLSDIDDLESAIASVARVVRTDGFFAFSLLHPCFPGWEAKQAAPSWSPERGYYGEGWWRASSPAHGLRPRVGANHRILSSYLNMFVRHRLMIEQTAEPPPSTDWLTEPPSVGPVPVYLVGRCHHTK
ncbi:MAG: class I SAM-dependent methyltransferase [Anaerolineales bacterium]